MVEAKADGKNKRREMGAEGRNEGKGRWWKVEGKGGRKVEGKVFRRQRVKGRRL